jgi:hypothetical protein
MTPVGTILSAIALSQIKKDPTQDGKGLAMAGLIISIIGMVTEYEKPLTTSSH